MIGGGGGGGGDNGDDDNTPVSLSFSLQLNFLLLFRCISGASKLGAAK